MSRIPIFIGRVFLPAIVLLALLANAGCSCVPTAHQATVSHADVGGDEEHQELPDLAGLDDEERLAALRSLGYVGSIDPGHNRLPRGLLARDRHRLSPGLTYYTSRGDCSGVLVDDLGRTVRRWRSDDCGRWSHSVLLEDGDVVAIHRQDARVDSLEVDATTRHLSRLSWEGRELWRRKLPAHHDVEVTPSGEIAVLLIRHRADPEIHPELMIRDNTVARLDDSGEILEEVSLLDVIRSTPEVFELATVRPTIRPGGEPLEVDPLHTNSLEWMRPGDLAGTHPLYSKNHVLVCMRHQDTIAILDWPTRRLVWAWGRGEISGPHDATLLANGHILIFDNGMDRSWSRVVELDPVSREIVWSYEAPEREKFFTLRHGGAQRLANGNTLITYSEQARLFEVTPDGDIAWDFRNSRVTNAGVPYVIYRGRRVVPADGPPFLRSD